MKQKQSGSGLIFAIILLFVILGMVITLSSITILETKMSQKTKSSVGAFYNSESGVEWALNQIATNTGTTINDVFGLQATNAEKTGKLSCPASFSNCEVYLLNDQGNVIAKDKFDDISSINLVKAVRSVGSETQGTQRAIEAAVASGGGGTYIEWGSSTCTQGSVIYDGEAIFPADGNGKGGVICLNGHLRDWPTSSSTTGTYWQNGKENAPAGSGTYDWAIVKCAVCAK